MKVAEIGSEMGKREGWSVGECFFKTHFRKPSPQQSEGPNLQEERITAPDYLSRVIKAVTPPTTQIASLPVWTNPSVQKTKSRSWRKWRRRSSYLHTPSVTVRCWICLMALRIAHFSAALGAEEHCEAELWLKREIWVANSDFAQFGRGGFHAVGDYQCYICAGREQMLKSTSSESETHQNATKAFFVNAYESNLCVKA